MQGTERSIAQPVLFFFFFFSPFFLERKNKNCLLLFFIMNKKQVEKSLNYLGNCAAYATTQARSKHAASSARERGGAPPTHKMCFCLFSKNSQRNDPSAGSPTDALLRLLFPLDHTVRLSFHSCESQSLKLTEKSIGKSDGRCVQRAGTYSGWSVEP
jgi:hypothetical protein